jgi:glycosyltransferase involved in cell wall biosynthesis
MSYLFFWGQKTLHKNSVSIIAPLYNEEGNVKPLIDAVEAALANYDLPWELLIVDDGSTDSTLDIMRECAEKAGPHVHVVELQRNYGQTAAMQAGIDAAQGSLLVTLDGDLQNDPADIPAMIDDLLARDLDLLQGWRKNRKDTLIMRKIPSRIANKLIRKVTGVDLHDYGCSLKVYRASAMKNVRLYGEMHRFIPAWVVMSVAPKRIGEIVVNHRERNSGESKYGISRTFRVVLDLLFVWFFMKYRTRPGHFFGSIGLFVGALSTLLFMWLGFDKLVLGNDIGGRPLLMIAVLLMIGSVQFLTTGLLSELLTRIYFESSSKRSYETRKEADDMPRGWFKSETEK